MAREVQVLHRDKGGARRLLPAERLRGVPLAEREAVWQPTRHPSQRSIATWWWAATNRRLVGCRSLGLLSTAMLLDFHPQVADLRAWSAQLVWRERGRERRLVPDFFVRTVSGATFVVLCPPATGPSGRSEGQLEVARDVGAVAGWQLATPQLPGAVALRNLRWVARRRHPRFGDAAVEAALEAAFTQLVPLREGIETCGVPRELALPRLYHMLWHRRLGTDWAEPLSPASLVGPLAAQAEPDAVRGPLAVEET